MEFFFYNKHIPVLRMKIIRLMIFFNGWVFFSHGASNLCGVLTASLSKIFFVLVQQEIDKAGKILNITYFCIMLILTLNNLNILEGLIKNLDIIQNKLIIIASDFNNYFNSKLETKGGKPLPIRKSIAKLVEIRES